MIWCVISWSLWDYYDYGCWCGYGGLGIFVDDIDRYCYFKLFCRFLFLLKFLKSYVKQINFYFFVVVVIWNCINLVYCVMILVENDLKKQMEN